MQRYRENKNMQRWVMFFFSQKNLRNINFYKAFVLNNVAIIL